MAQYDAICCNSVPIALHAAAWAVSFETKDGQSVFIGIGDIVEDLL